MSIDSFFLFILLKKKSQNLNRKKNTNDHVFFSLITFKRTNRNIIKINYYKNVDSWKDDGDSCLDISTLNNNQFYMSEHLSIVLRDNLI